MVRNNQANARRRAAVIRNITEKYMKWIGGKHQKDKGRHTIGTEDTKIKLEIKKKVLESIY